MLQPLKSLVNVKHLLLFSTKAWSRNCDQPLRTGPSTDLRILSPFHCHSILYRTFIGPVLFNIKTIGILAHSCYLLSEIKSELNKVNWIEIVMLSVL